MSRFYQRLVLLTACIACGQAVSAEPPRAVPPVEIFFSPRAAAWMRSSRSSRAQRAAFASRPTGSRRGHRQSLGGGR